MSIIKYNVNNLFNKIIFITFLLLTIIPASYAQNPDPIHALPTIISYIMDEDTEPDDSTVYNITLEFSGAGFTAARQQVFQDAAQLWENVITGDVSDFSVGLTLTDCDGNAYTVNTIDDLYIQAKIAFIDGPGGILGSAGPRYVRSNTGENGIPVSGCMTFDSDDITALETNGTFQAVILHEMGHVIGIGTVWNYTNNTNCPTSFAFIGTNSVTEWTALGGTGILPVENGGGSGTQCGHWDEETFDTELMTGYIDPSMQLSSLTIASLEDLKYTVDYTVADNYSLPGCSPNCSSLLGGPADSGPWEVLLTPIPIE